VTVEHEKILQFNPLNAELNPICHLLALLGAHLIFHVSRIWVKAKWLLYVSPGLYILPTEHMYVCYMDLREKMAAIYLFSVN
jgi:hypothetical protein